MSRKTTQRRHDRIVYRQRAELEAERDRLRAITADCYDEHCCCHLDDWRELRDVLFLLREDR